MCHGENVKKSKSRTPKHVKNWSIWFYAISGRKILQFSHWRFVPSSLIWAHLVPFKPIWTSKTHLVPLKPFASNFVPFEPNLYLDDDDEDASEASEAADFFFVGLDFLINSPQFATLTSCKGLSFLSVSSSSISLTTSLPEKD